MAKKKSGKGKGSNGFNGSQPHPSGSKSLRDATRSESDTTSGKAASNLPPAIDAQTAAGVADLAMEIEFPNLKNLATEVTVPSSTVSDTTAVVNIGIEMVTETKSPRDSQDVRVPSPASPKASASSPNPAELWKGFVKEASIKLFPKEKPFLLDSGEACVTIPNVVVEKNKKAWECFIIGQFYEEGPAGGAVHAIVNGIWSKHRRDITVSKMDNQAFLFRVPCPHARRRILSQSLWQIDGLSMFVAKWSPGIQQVKPELKMVPVWLEFRGVPLQFFNGDALKEIAGMVGHPVCLHPSTEQLTNIEVAKVYTVIDPRKPLPEFVNARFESGDTRRISVSSPFLPAVCSFCKKVGHSLARCKAAPRTCTLCNSVKHLTVECSRYNREKAKGKAPIKSLLPIVPQTKAVYKPVGEKSSGSPLTANAVAEKTVDPAIRTPPPTKSSSPPPSRAKAMGNRQRYLSPTNNQSERIKSPLWSAPIEFNDLREGCLIVDLSPYAVAHQSNDSHSSGHSSGHMSDGSNLSGDEDNPDDGEDKYIEVISRRMKKQLKGKSRGGGPLIL
ncbi:hypothetical protein BRARA_K00370 [Brassica rapa]|uniref:DUF4283 domain-containing protein n=1 Tax=Brassica campestris TaxID=3711 RepID=A0A397L8X1_BRACM|nr:hypothetical protein BRARA_K00370 [Brassica rapa]